MSLHDKSLFSRGRVSRRNMLKGSLASALTIPALTPAFASTQEENDKDNIILSHQWPFYGDQGQSGITTPPQRHIMYMTFDMTTPTAQTLQILLARWSAAIAQLVQGATVGTVEPSRNGSVGTDTGEAVGLDPSSLTVTIGLGPSIFTDTYGLKAKCPTHLRPLSALPSDNLQPELSGGDLSLQACADDPQVAYHAIRVLARIAKTLGAAQTRWTVMGFGRASAGKGEETPRNLFGFKDGTRNLVEKSDFDQHVWVQQGPAWEHYGSYQVVRKIKMNIENWDTDRVSDQNNIFGRHKLSGAPLSGTHEFDTPDFHKKNPDGELVIPATAHIRLAAHENNQGVRILRRSYNYTDGLNQYGQLDAGLLFISYQNDPAHFEQLQRKLGASDALNEYISHIGSALFFVPPAAKEGSYIGAELFS
ncbi:iron uptake transporter deferrochelatase/peroxidase subunit [Rosenbergiella australiborealis]|uniref:Deferrochelatase n=1 Tax=Rosenbergiella australiborealis TaxID=1544696 RepID=A0ABS5T790_9GAMM|nr:iron uptake transporter deferrochelatase/peroxidase subunit [Rosenbergiella australiborealis]MBT0728230.1 deferrochelatase/peroxidase EfeB [Rosenbergiella australiborealis]